MLPFITVARKYLTNSIVTPLLPVYIALSIMGSIVLNLTHVKQKEQNIV